YPRSRSRRTRRRWWATHSFATSKVRAAPACAASGWTAACGPSRDRPPTRGSSGSATFALRSTRWSGGPLRLQRGSDLVGPRVEVRGEDEHHVEQIRELADRPFATFAAERARRLARLFHELRGDAVVARPEELGAKRAGRAIAPALRERRRELAQEPREV